jgi:hypothetical protein
LSYQWRFNGADIPGATASSLIVTSVQFTNLGRYSVLVANSVNSTVSSDASLGFADLTGWGSPNDSGSAGTVPPLEAANLLAIAAGHYFSLALRADGTVLAWGGLNLEGELISPPTDLTDVIAIAAGGGRPGLAKRWDCGWLG